MPLPDPNSTYSLTSALLSDVSVIVDDDVGASGGDGGDVTVGASVGDGVSANVGDGVGVTVGVSIGDDVSASL